jgi:predicted ATPase/transcriptional regulator with XRE-family HTH domain
MEAITSFGYWVRRRRKALDLTQATLAQQVGCSTIAIKKIEADERRPSAVMTERLADALQIGAAERLPFFAAARGEQPVDRLPQPDSPPPAPLADGTHLPSPLTPLVGRQAEVAALIQVLHRPLARLVTLVGPAGVGKTRLALAAAQAILDIGSGTGAFEPLDVDGPKSNITPPQFPDGVWFVPLAAVREAELVPVTIAQSLALPVQQGAHPPLAQLSSHLSTKQLLLVLDNFEHLPGAAPALATLLATCPGLQILLTSREAAHLSGEQIYEVPPLVTPTLERLDEDQSLAQYPAVQLFVARAQAVNPRLVFDHEQMMAVAAICAHLDGLPLAIELAASRTTLFPPVALLARLTRDVGARLALLNSGMRDAPARHQTLRQALAWSYDLLTEAEQRLFRRLSVFVGGCTLEGAEAIYEGEESELPLFEQLASLIDKSLIHRIIDKDGEPRCLFLETLREYGLEQLRARGELSATQRAHATYYLALAERIEPLLTGPHQAHWLDRLEAEQPNVRAALHWSISSDEGAIGAGLGAALWHFWYVRGHAHEGRQWLERLLTLPHSAGQRAKLLYGLGMLARRQGEGQLAYGCFEQSLTLARQCQDLNGVSAALRLMGFLKYQQGDYPAAMRLLDESLALFRQVGNQEGIAAILTNLGYIANALGEPERARQLFAESLAQRRASGNHHGVCTTLAALAYVALEQQDTQAARAYITESLTISRELQHRSGEVTALQVLGEVAFAEDAYATAHERYTECLALATELGECHVQANAQLRLGTLKLKLGEVPPVRPLLAEALASFARLNQIKEVATTLDAFAMLALAQGQAERAIRLLAAAATLFTGIKAIRLPTEQRAHDDTAAAAQQRLGQANAATAWATGAALSLTEAVAYALQAEQTEQKHQ